MIKIEKQTVTNTVSVDFPFVEAFSDYHDIEFKAHDLSTKLNADIKYAEIGSLCAKGYYWGLFHVGRKPRKAIVDQLLEEDGYVARDLLEESSFLFGSKNG